MQKGLSKRELVCPTCNGTFTAVHPRAKFCSEYCKNKAAKPTVQKVCKGCGKKFMAKANRQKFCTQSCALSHNRPTKIMVCKVCGESFTFVGRGYKWYCDKRRKIRNKELAQEHRRKRGGPVGIGSGGNQRGSKNHQSKDYDGPRNVTAYQEIGRAIWGNACVICGVANTTMVHHIDWNRDNNAKDNLIVLCASCHSKVHAALQHMVSKDELVNALFHVWPNGRLKIAEKHGNPTFETGQSEVKAESNVQPAAETRE